MAYTIPQPEPTDGDTSWFVHDRFGMFIHWGLYALPARHEWVKSREKISTEDYEKYFKHFDPDLYDPTLWAEAAADAGMKYFVVTTKHHEGFCLWDTAQTDYKVTKTPYGKDLLTPMVDAFRSKGLKVGFYHSLLDWYHPHYTADVHHPMRENAEYREADANRDLNRYAEYLHAQSRELLTEFGKVDILWYDFSVQANEALGFAGKGKEVWQSEKLIQLVRELQPHILINDRLQIDQDLKTPEQFQPREWLKVNGKPVVWEACQTFSGSWGYHRDEDSWKTVDMLVQMLIDSVSKGGNLLLNVGPTGRGEFDERAMDRLRGMGEWMRRHNRSIYGCTQAPAEVGPAPQDCRYTFNPQTNRLYVHVFAWPFKNLHLPNMADKVEYAQLLNDASEVKMRKFEIGQGGNLRVDGNADNLLTLELPIKKPNVTVPVIELFLK
ncbi:MAG: alpha-L-fucosidase [Armatimonadaceae bacterium]